jgi:PPM family protein phosphatase
MSSRTASPTARGSAPHLGRPRLRAAIRTDVGAVREHNEDAAHADAARGLFIVADGVGGHAAGEVASAIAVDVVRMTIEESQGRIARLAGAADRCRQDRIAALLGEAVQAAHHAVRRVARCEPDKHGMATTLDVVLVVGDEAYVAHVGDTRTYLIRGGQALQVTRDHTMAQAMVQAGQLTPEAARETSLRSVLVNALGTRPRVAVDLLYVPLCAGDQLLLSSDGCYDYFDIEEIAGRLTWNDPVLAAAEMVEIAVARGGHDNATAVVVDGAGTRSHAALVHGPVLLPRPLEPAPVVQVLDEPETLYFSSEGRHEYL